MINHTDQVNFLVYDQPYRSSKFPVTNGRQPIATKFDERQIHILILPQQYYQHLFDDV
jgi:hypothetical protein